MISQKDYWERRFREGKVWGDQPCPSAHMAIPHFQENGIEKIIVPGCGYGRNSIYFARNGFSVTGVDISHEAIKRAVNDIEVGMNNLDYQARDLFSLDLINEQFDAVFLSNVIHLFLKKDRSNLVQIMDSLIVPNGLFIFTAISESDDKNFGIGKEIEQNTFLHNGKVLHLYTEGEIKSILPHGYNIMEQNLHTQTETDPLGQEEDLALWFIVAKKQGN